jgi:hypothetical protein
MLILQPSKVEGVMQLEETNFELPLYQIGYWLALGKEPSSVQGTVTRVFMEMLMLDGVLMQYYSYELEGVEDPVLESEVKFYQDLEE